MYCTTYCTSLYFMQIKVKITTQKKSLSAFIEKQISITPLIPLSYCVKNMRM